MSLQVWIPFTDGTLKQQGVNNSAVSSGGTISLTGDGKLGKCVTFTSTAGGLTIPPSTMTSFTTECSVSFWLKINGWGSSYDTYFQAGTGSTPWAAYIFGFLRNGSGSTICFTIGNSSSASNNSYVTSTMSTGVWYHVTLTYETGKVRIYLNGSLDKEYTTSIVPAFNKITKISVGRSNADSSYQTQCSMNDLRIYDNCLSAQEVKEISNGLILHYPLNRRGFGHNNILLDTQKDKNTSHSTYNIADFNFSESLVANNVYTITAKITASSEKRGVGFYHSGGSYIMGSWMSISSTGIYRKTFTASSSMASQTGGSGHGFCRVYLSNNNAAAQGSTAVTGTGHVDWIKIEAGEVSTAWCPNTADTLYTTLGISNTIEYDASGCQYNGTRNSTFAWGDVSPKYNVSTKFTGTNYISLTSPTAEAKTLSIWVKWDTIPSGQSVVFLDYKSKLGLGLMSTGILCGTSGPGNFYTFSKSSLVANTWYHFVVVNTGTATSTTRDLYINGVKQTQTSSASNWTYSVDQTQIGKRSTSSDGFVGLLSDVRLYATALTANDVLSLYNNGAYIDSAGNIHGKIR